MTTVPFLDDSQNYPLNLEIEIESRLHCIDMYDDDCLKLRTLNFEFFLKEIYSARKVNSMQNWSIFTIKI